ncbi:MAG TPA: PIN domain-containing protein [Paenalcaligenes sp.]|nr:PIN domain-containing protein [Paenalcaligenes sp.]
MGVSSSMASAPAVEIDASSVLVLDACILISNVLRFLSLELAREHSFQPAWSAIIGDEWARNASRLWDVPVEQLWQDWEQWQREFPLADQGNVQGYKEGLQYSDPKDWHVIAAARAAQHAFPDATVRILTKNLKDFNRSELKRLGLSVVAPDHFFVAMHHQYPSKMNALLQRLPQAVVAPDKPLLSVEVLLKRERLFGLNQAYQRSVLLKGEE